MRRTCYKVTRRAGEELWPVLSFTTRSTDPSILTDSLQTPGSSKVLLFLTNYTRRKYVLHSPLPSCMATSTPEGMLYGHAITGFLSLGTLLVEARVIPTQVSPFLYLLIVSCLLDSSLFIFSLPMKTWSKAFSLGVACARLVASPVTHRPPFTFQ